MSTFSSFFRINGHQNGAFSCLIGALNSPQKVNGYGADYATFMTHMAAIIMHVAAGHIDEELLARIIPPVIKGEDFSEELKIDIAHAMESGELFSE